MAVVGPASLRLALMGVVLGALLLGQAECAGVHRLWRGSGDPRGGRRPVPHPVKKLEAERLTSEQRLSDPGYARALKKAGYDIPGRYLKEEEAT